MQTDQSVSESGAVAQSDDADGDREHGFYSTRIPIPVAGPVVTPGSSALEFPEIDLSNLRERILASRTEAELSAGALDSMFGPLFARLAEMTEDSAPRFDGDKESFVILHPSLGEGDDFRLPCLMVDSQLRMQVALETLLKQARPKMQALMRTRSYYALENMMLRPGNPRASIMLGLPS